MLNYMIEISKYDDKLKEMNSWLFKNKRKFNSDETFYFSLKTDFLAIDRNFRIYFHNNNFVKNWSKHKILLDVALFDLTFDTNFFESWKLVK